MHIRFFVFSFLIYFPLFAQTKKKCVNIFDNSQQIILKDPASFRDKSIGFYLFDIQKEWISPLEIKSIYKDTRVGGTNFPTKLIRFDNGEAIGPKHLEETKFRRRRLIKKKLPFIDGNRETLPLPIIRLVKLVTEHINQTIHKEHPVFPRTVFLRKADENTEPLGPQEKHADRIDPLIINITLLGEPNKGTVAYVGGTPIETRVMQALAMRGYAEHQAPFTEHPRMTVAIIYVYESKKFDWRAD